MHILEDKPIPLYRRVCYTFAWNAALSFALLNLAALLIVYRGALPRTRPVEPGELTIGD